MNAMHDVHFVMKSRATQTVNIVDEFLKFDYLKIAKDFYTYNFKRAVVEKKKRRAIGKSPDSTEWGLG